MLHKYLRHILIPIVSLVVSTNSVADQVTGDIAENTTWTADGNPWVLTAASPSEQIKEVRVIPGVTLTIEAGVVIEVNGALSINVEGELIARGTEQSPITVRPQQASGQWHTIVFQSGSAPAIFNNGVYESGSILEYVNLQAGGGPSIYLSELSPSTPAQGVVYLNGGRPYLNHVSITDGDAVGIFAIGIDNELKIENSSIINNHDTSGDKPGAIFIQGAPGSNVEISNNTIQHNTSTATSEGGGVVTLRDIDILSVINNSILDNVSASLGGGLYLLNLLAAQTNYVVEDNMIGRNIAENRGGGIAVQDSKVIIRNNQIFDNDSNLNGGGVSVITNSEVLLDNNAIINNYATADGGGIYVNTTAATNIAITNNAIAANSTEDRGGGIYVEKDTITITNNMIADNQSANTMAAMEINAGGTVSRNSIVRNQSDSIISFGNTAAVLNFADNNISQNSSTIYVVNNTSSTLPVITGNNIVSNGAGYYLSNNAVGTTLITNNNWYGTTDPAVLQNNIDVAIDSIDYSAHATAIITDPVPISPPPNFSITQNGDVVSLTWDAPPETDLAGYIVYWGNKSAPTYEYSSDVGLNQSFTVPGLDSTLNYYFAVTAYDSDYASISDDPATLINEKQTSGNESWFSEEAVIMGVVPVTGGGGGGGSTVWWSLLLLLALQLYRRTSVISTESKL